MSVAKQNEIRCALSMPTITSRASLERLARALETAGRKVTIRGDVLDAQCPAHEDRTASMSARWVPPEPPDRAGRVLVNCHAGCALPEILAALDLAAADLYDGKSELGRSPGSRGAERRSKPPVPSPRPSTPGNGAAPADGQAGAAHEHNFTYLAPETQHVYTDADGEVIGRVDRLRCTDPECPDLAEKGHAGKTFVTRRPDGTKGKPPALGTTLYRLPEVVSAIADGRPVWLCEGEGDADAVAAAGECGTSAYGGAARKWPGAYTETLTGADVIIAADRDRAGYRRAAAVAAELAPAARSVRVVAAAVDRPGADVSDHLAAGLGLDEMTPIGVAPPPPAGPPPGSGKSAAAGSEPADSIPEPPPPRYRLPSSSGAWGYSTGDDGPGFAAQRGVYREVSIGDGIKVWLWVEELPYVFARIVHRDGAARRARMSYRLGTRLDATFDERTLAGHLAVKTGEWAEPLGVPLSADDKVIRAVASAIYREAGRSAPMVEAAPRWTPDGMLDLPPDDCGPAGYGATAGNEDAARRTWAELAEIMDRHPKVALVAGAALAAPYVAALRRQSYIVHLAGRDRRGKTTAQIVSAAIYGDPEIIVRPWDASAIGLSQMAGEYGCLPPILDELGARRGPRAELQNIVFQFAQGARRTKGGREGQSRMGAPWRGVLLSTGNISLLAHLTERGAIARVVEVPTPIVGTDDAVDDPAAAADAEALESLAAEAHGWPFVWLRRAGVTPARFGAAVAVAETTLGIAGGGTLRTFGRHLAAAVTGATVLDRVLGCDGLGNGALAAARELLAEMAVRLDEISAPPAERLARAVAHAVISRPDAFPPLADLRNPGSSRRYRDGEGFRITAPPDDMADARPYAPPPGLAAGDVGVLCDLLPKIGADGGLDDVMTALRNLRDAGRLITSGEGDGRLRRRIRIGGLMADAYMFRLGEEDDDDGDSRTRARTPMDDGPGTPGTDQLAALSAAETLPVAVPGAPGTDQLTGNSPPPAETPDAANRPMGETAGGGTVPGAVPGAAVPGADRYPAGPVLLIDADAAYLGDGAGVPAPAGLADMLDLAAALGLGAPRLHKSGRDADPHLYLTPAACERYGIPAEPPDVRTLALAEDHPAALALREAGWTVAAIRPSTQVYRRGEDAASLSVTLLGWLPHAAPGLESLIADDPPPASLARRLGVIAATAYPLRWTAGVTSSALMVALRPPYRLRHDSETGDRRREHVPGSLAEPVPPSLYDAHGNHPVARGRADADECREESLIWTRPREHWTDEELAAPWAVVIDVNTMFLAAAASLPVGLSAPRLLDVAELAAVNAELAAPKPKIRPGAYVAEVGGLPADPRLPCPLTETGEWPGGPLPLHAPTLRYAAELGAAVTVSAAAVSDETGPYLDPWNRRLVAALRDQLAAAGITPEMPPADYLAALARMPAEHPDAAAVVAVIKSLAKAGIGRMRQDPDGTGAAERATWRPDIRAEVISRARTDLHRKIMRTFTLTGVAPLAVSHDAVLYAAADPSPASVIPATIGGAPVRGAFRLGCRPGWVKHSHTIPMAEALGQLDAGLNPAARRTGGNDD